MLIKVEQLSYLQVLHDLSMQVEEGDWVTIIGKSGSGKSTLLKLIAGLISPTSGHIYYQGQDITDLDPIKLRQSVSYCYQQPVLFGETVADNLNFPFKIRHQQPQHDQLVASLQSVQLPAEFLTKKITELSGGEKQRVAMIRNLLFHPKVVLLDEVTAGLDEESKQAVHQFLVKAHQNGTTFIQVTHEIDEIANAEQKLVLENGGLHHEELSR